MTCQSAKRRKPNIQTRAVVPSHHRCDFLFGGDLPLNFHLVAIGDSAGFTPSGAGRARAIGGAGPDCAAIARCGEVGGKSRRGEIAHGAAAFGLPEIDGLRACLMLPQHAYDLLFRKPGSLHLSVLEKAGH